MKIPVGADPSYSHELYTTRAFTYPRRRQNVLKVQRHGTQSQARSRGIITLRGVAHMWLRMSLVKRTVGQEQGPRTQSPH